MTRARTAPINFRVPKWQKVRAQLVCAADFTCRHCGWRPPNPPENYDGKQAVAHWYPRSRGWRHELTFRILEIDHVIPRALGGTSDISNLQVLCNSCNSRKGGT